MKRKLVVLWCLLLAVPSVAFHRAVRAESEPKPCVAGRTAAAVGFWTWPANSEVNLYLRTPDFGEGYAPAVKTAMDNWNVAAAESSANVHFSFKGLTNGAQISQGDLILIRRPVYSKTAAPWRGWRRTACAAIS